MDNKKSILNVIVSIMFRIVLLISNLMIRRFLIQYLGNDINGLNSLYLSLIGVLSVAELGIGDAITFCMYKPIVEGDAEKVATLYNLFKKVYYIIGAIIAVAGCLLMPFLPYLAKGYTNLDVNLYGSFGLMLLSVLVTYFFSANTSLMNAYKDNFIATTITSCGQLLQHFLQFVTLLVTQSFVGYLICRIMAAGAQWILSEMIARRKYKYVCSNVGSQLDEHTKKNIIKNVKALFMHRIGGVLVNTVDSIVISAFIGVTILGKYSNYTIIMTAMTSTITLFFTPLTSAIGHLFVKDKDAFKRYYNFFYALNFVLGSLFFLGYYSIINNLIALLFGNGLELKRAISFIITVNYFVQFMRQATLLFRDASGTFYYDRWKSLGEGLTNLVLSIIFVMIFPKILGDDFAVVGVIVATIITNIFICHIVEPYVLYKHAFHMSVKKCYLRNYCCITIFILLLIILNVCMVTKENKWIELLVNGSIAVGLSLIAAIIVFVVDKDFRYYVGVLLRKAGLKIHS